MSELSKMIEFFAKSLFGITREEAWEKRICIDCKHPVEDFEAEMDELDREEYKITALCPACYEKSCKKLRGV